MAVEPPTIHGAAFTAFAPLDADVVAPFAAGSLLAVALVVLWLQGLTVYLALYLRRARRCRRLVHTRPETNQRLLRRINTFLNAILLGVTETYE